MNLTIRAAKIEELESIEALINRSTRELQRGVYEESEIEAALELISGLDTLIHSGQYFVAEIDRRIAGCGGVSLSLDEETSAEIRGFFVAPEYARKGVASSVFDYCEKYCSERGVKSLFLASTLSGESFYRKRGFTEIGRVQEPLSNGQFFQLVNMKKQL
ncbi:MAG: GNAT family N-acetyltransferase [Marinomonas foliarum]|uniref:N-acetylglutamate synthase-like GNAT family acetyltransferase n=1 Tax=Marinomonas foliarum TaxID=491950 RepID=A0A368ZYR7_9GAMM|nr:GNAT family N-acetyltransferase [Marinomonas foliarum]RCX00977.1 N-acetylglutamate synthase-like GNAT family acetyltransferase [Marinomonas foliarum]